jgi:hypothetical protein
MTAKQGVTLASRVLCIYFLIAAGFLITDLPPNVMAYLQYSAHDGYSHTSFNFQWNLAHIVFMITVYLLLALLFFRCGPKLTAFLLDESPAPEGEEDPH